MAVPLIKCKHLGDTLDRIRHEHMPNKWLYRGQVSRRMPHRFMEDDQIFELENLYPQSFRFVTSHSAITDSFMEKWKSEHDKAESLFEAFNNFLFSKYEFGHLKETSRFNWLDPYAEEWRQLFRGSGSSFFSRFHENGIGLKDPALIRLSWSLAQHYDVVTALLDVTFDPDVAAWFATNLWDEPKGPRSLEGDGIIYRFDIETLRAVIALHNRNVFDSAKGNAYRAPEDNAFIQDIRHIPSAFGLRPSRQEAAVISGFDALSFVTRFDEENQRVERGRIAAFIFPHFADELSRWPLKYSREYLIAPDDPFLDLKEEFETKWKPDAELIHKVKYSKPVMFLTQDGIKLANIPDQLAQENIERERQALYDSGMASLGLNNTQAEQHFQHLIRISVRGNPDRLSCLAHARTAVIRFLNKDFDGTARELALSLEGPSKHPSEAWVGQFLQTIAQGADQLRCNQQGELALDILKRVVEIAHRSGSGELVLEVELGGLVLIGILESQIGNAQLGLAYLKTVAQKSLVGLTPAQRSFVATPLDALAQADEQLAEQQRATEIYSDIVSRFADDEWPSTIKVVARAREKLL